MSDELQAIVSMLCKDQVKLATELTKRIQRSDLEKQALQEKVELLRSAIETALRGTQFDACGNRDDDGLLTFGNTSMPIQVLTEALSKTSA